MTSRLSRGIIEPLEERLEGGAKRIAPVVDDDCDRYERPCGPGSRTQRLLSINRFRADHARSMVAAAIRRAGRDDLPQ